MCLACRQARPPYTSPLFTFTGNSAIQLTNNHYDKGLNTLDALRTEVDE